MHLTEPRLPNSNLVETKYKGKIIVILSFTGVIFYSLYYQSNYENADEEKRSHKPQSH